MSAPHGLEVFRQYFADFADQYVLIGGTASFLAMDAAGLDARLTKDLDIVLLAEALTPEFGRTFWRFVDAGGYRVQQEAAEPRRFYRFSKPADPAYPAMLELFSRLPDGIRYSPPRVLTPIPFDESVASLSAILLDDAYYAMLHQGMVHFEGLSWVNERVLIPLKMKAWLDLRERKAAGHAVDEKDIRKHFNDVLRLSRILPLDARVPLPEAVGADVATFIGAALSQADHTASLKLGAGVTLASLLDDLQRVFA
ncbi:MAG: hypothetical protein RBS35_00235 [Azonexus sp.]|jgi:hypothetical protein|nr:hypothetical protein [Azonexus sp.]